MIAPDTRVSLPRPDAEAAAHSSRLRARIVEEIQAAGGVIGFDRFQNLALYEPGLGYYSAGAVKLGPDGDFVTAPELSSLFARCVARACATLLTNLNGGDILELGAGSGALAVDLLSELAHLDVLPGRYRILEVSADLRERQQARISAACPKLADRVEWLDTMSDEPHRGVILANEVLDALAVERFRIGPDGPERLGVAWVDGQFAWTSVPAGVRLWRAVRAIEADLALPLAEGYESEVCLELDEWLAAIAAPLVAGLLICVDYGLPRREFYHPERDTGTLMCHYRHRAHADPFVWPGLQDITAWVDFTAVADAGLAAGLDLKGLTTQAAFLLDSGITTLIESGAPTMSPAARAAARRLLMPGEMGERFKVIGFGRDCPSPLPGLTLADLSGSL